MKKFLFLLVSSLALGNTQLISSGVHTCAINQGNELYCWGNNDFGQLGTGKMTPSKSPELLKQKFKQLSVGRYSSCGLSMEGKVHCWGWNDQGQLGLGVTTKEFGKLPEETVDKVPPLNLGDQAKVVEVAAGQKHNCAIFDNGKVKCWGKNFYGELGISSTANNVGTLSTQMGNALPFINLGDKAKVKSLALGDNFTCALLDEGSVKCWGKGANNGSGTGKDLGKVAEEMGDNLKPLNLGQPAQKLVAGQNFACAQLKDERLYCWGQNDGGVFGNGFKDRVIVGMKPEEMGSALKPVELGSLRPVGVDCGFSHCCAVLENQAMKCWGSNDHGQLGLGHIEMRGTDLTKMGDALPYVNLGAFAAVQSITMGTVHTCVTLQDDKIRCFGKNSYKQMGPAESSGTSPETMGEALLPMELPKN